MSALIGERKQAAAIRRYAVSDVYFPDRDRFLLRHKQGMPGAKRLWFGNASIPVKPLPPSAMHRWCMQCFRGSVQGSGRSER